MSRHEIRDGDGTLNPVELTLGNKLHRQRGSENLYWQFEVVSHPSTVSKKQEHSKEYSCFFGAGGGTLNPAELTLGNKLHRQRGSENLYWQFEVVSHPSTTSKYGAPL